MRDSLDFVFVGLSITSSWGNGHATTYRALLRELARRGHRVLFLERDVPWYAANRDLPAPSFARARLYASFDELVAIAESDVREADVVVIGSYVPDGAQVAAWALGLARGKTAFYDIDTPVTVAGLARGTCGYLTRALVPRFDLYLSFTGGPMLRQIEDRLGAPRARALYCSVDPSAYFPELQPIRWDMGYLGTYSADRQPALEALLLEPARRWQKGRFIVAGPQYPEHLPWPQNVQRMVHLSPAEHRAFYNAQRFALNVTRADMAKAGYSPSVRIFEAAACGTPIVSDWWPGLEHFLQPGREILVARSGREALAILRGTGEEERRSVALRARERILKAHTAERRAEVLERWVYDLFERDAGHRSPALRSPSEAGAA